MKIQLNITCFALILLLFCANMPQARAEYDLQTGLIPPQYYGQWATPNCEAPNNVLNIHGYLILEASPDTSLIYRITKTENIDDKVMATVADMAWMFDMQPDKKKMVVSRMYEDEQHTDDNLPFSAELENHQIPYYACDGLALDWKSLDTQSVSAAPLLYDLEQSCGGEYIEHSPACQNKTFSFLDHDQSATLDKEELIQAYELMVFYAGSAFCEFPHVYTDSTANEAATFADQAIKAMDTNEDYALSLTEIIGGWDIAQLQPAVIKFMTFSNDLSLLLYTVPHYPYYKR